MTKAYVYRLTDTFDGKKYIGSNYSEGCDPSWLGTKYFTSSKFIRSIFQENTSRFLKEILVVGTPEYVLDMETKILRTLDARRSPEYYNCHNNENNLNSQKVGKITRDRKTGVHGRTKEKMSQDGRKAGKRSCDLRHAKKDETGKSIFAKQIGTASHWRKDKDGKSVRQIEIGSRPHWWNPETGEKKRSNESPGEGFVRGRGKLPRKTKS